MKKTIKNISSILCFICLFFFASVSFSFINLKVPGNNKNLDQDSYGYSHLISTAHSQVPEHDLMNNLLLTNGEHKLTPDPNEEINLYSGNFRLKYTDYSVAVAPGLNIEINRDYTSGIYSYEPTNYAEDKFMSSWHMGTAYIYESTEEACDRENCYALLVNTDGSIREFIDDTEKPGWGKTRDNWQMDPPNNTIYNPQGVKYIFGHHLELYKHKKYFLTKVETPDGHWIEYHYDGVFIDKITNSDSQKNIEISINKTKYYSTYCVQHCESSRKERKYQTYYFPVPETVYFNGKKILEYDYSLGYNGFALMLTTVKKTDGELWRYNYRLYQINSRHSGGGDHNFRVQLENVISPSGSEVTYKQGQDPDNMYSHGIYGLRLASRSSSEIPNVMPAGNWQFNYAKGTDSNNVNTKIVTVTGPAHAIKNIYSDSNNDYVWRQGRLLDQTVYRDNNINDNNIIQHDIYNLDKVPKYEENYRLTRTTKYPAVDKEVCSAKLISKTTSLYYPDGIDNYITEYAAFDENDIPRNIIQSFSSNGTSNSRTINIDYFNLKEKNIIGLPAKVFVNNKLIQEVKYDENGHSIYSNKLGTIKRQTYNKGLLETVTDELNNTIRYADYNGVEPQLIINADNTRTKQVVNSDGTIASATDANNNTSHYTYNDLGELITEQPALGSIINHEYTYTNNGLIKTTNHGRSNLVENINYFGEPNSKIENNSREFKYGYDALGRKTFVSYPGEVGNYNNKGHYYYYDALNRITADCYPSQNSNCITYEYSANNTRIINYANGEYRINTYSSYNNPDKLDLIGIKEANRETIITRDVLGYVLNVQQGNINKTYEYDSKYNLAKYFEPETGVTTYKYDDVGNLIEKNQNGQATKYELHKKNYRLLKTNYSDGSYSTKYEYDNNGNLIYLQKGKAENIYEYNKLNKLKKETLRINYFFSKREFDTSYRYNSENDLETIVYPDGSELNLQPNEYGLPTQIGAYVNNIGYYSSNHWRTLTLGNQVLAGTELDEQQRVNRYYYGSISLNYNYDNNSNLKSLKLSDAKDSNYDYTLDFNYDKQGRIIAAIGPWGELSYKYDQNDNILSINNSTNNHAQNFFYDSNNRLINLDKSKDGQIYSKNQIDYDKNGNVTNYDKNKYSYGLDGNLSTVYNPWASTYEYDGNQQRVIKSNSGQDIITVYTKAGDAIYEYDEYNNTQIKYVYFNGHKVAAETSLIKNKKESTINYFYNDSIGSPIAQADASGATLWHEIYQPFGQKHIDEKNTNKTNKYWFAGKEVDDTNLSYFGARYYSSVSGRFMSPDPVSINPENPNTFNRYSYANNNPYKYVDPDGRFVWLALLPVVLSFIDAAITANDTYGAYQEGGLAAAGTELAVGLGISRIPGGKAVNTLLKYSKAEREIGTIYTRVTKNTTKLGGGRGEPGLKIKYKDGTEFDMTRTRVKETELNTYVDGSTRPVKYENALNKQGTKRAPTKDELDWFNNISW